MNWKNQLQFKQCNGFLRSSRPTIVQLHTMQRVSPPSDAETKYLGPEPLQRMRKHVIGYLSMESIIDPKVGQEGLFG